MPQDFVPCLQAPLIWFDYELSHNANLKIDIQSSGRFEFAASTSLQVSDFTQCERGTF